MNNCRYCNSALIGKYCHNCGKQNELKRIDRSYILTEVNSVLNFDKGILYTTKELMVRPGVTIRRFIHKDRNRLVKPIIFIIVSSLIYSLFRQIFHFEDNYMYIDDTPSSATTIIFKWVQNNYGYANLILGVFIAFWIKIMFKKYNYNFYEILILLCFVMGIGMIILAIFGLFEGITRLKVLQFGGTLFLIYSTWAIAQFFDKKKFLNYVKALVSYILGIVTFTLGIFLFGGLVDFIKDLV